MYSACLVVVLEVHAHLLQTSATMDSITLVSVVTNLWKSCLMQNECNGKVLTI